MGHRKKSKLLLNNLDLLNQLYQSLWPENGLK